MKKVFAVCICCGLALTFTGCSLGNIVDRFASTGDTSAMDETVAVKDRVYMDELAGILQDFDGSLLTMRDGDVSYTFDISHATLECQDGMITGNELSVIYEGQLSDTDTSAVKALKVVDEFHKKDGLKNRTAHGKVLGLTANTITIQSNDGKTATYPITGTEQYYQNGIKAGNRVYLHFKGKFPAQNESAPDLLNASHLKVLSVSDIDPLSVPAPTPTPKPTDGENEENNEKQLRVSVQNISLNTLQVLPLGSDTAISIDLSSVPSYFKGGIAPGSCATVFYTGEFSAASAEGMSVTAVTGDDPDSLSESEMTSTVSGIIIGSTTNTVTVQTNDGAAITCRTDNVPDSSTGAMEIGSSIRITFNASASTASNIYSSIKIEDA